MQLMILVRLVPLERFGPTVPATTDQALRIFHAPFAQGYRALMLLRSEVAAIQFYWMLSSNTVIFAAFLCCSIKPGTELLSVMRLWHPRTLLLVKRFLFACLVNLKSWPDPIPQFNVSFHVILVWPISS